MTQKFANDARALLASSISDSATSIVLESGLGDLFPIATLGVGVPGEGEGDWFKCTLENASGQREIVIVRTRASGSDILSNVQRGIESTTARAFDTGTVIGLRPTAGDVGKILEFQPNDYVPRAGGVEITGAMELNEVTLKDRLTTPPHTLTGTTPVISSEHAMQVWTTEGNSTPTFDVPIGTSTTLIVTMGGAHTVDWSGVAAWLWASQPVMADGQTHVITLFNYSGQVRGNWGGRF